MIRKLLMVAAAAAMPMGAVAVGALGAGTAVAAPTYTCSLNGGVVTFNGGLSANGSVTTAKTNADTSSGITFAGAGCGSGGSTIGRTITSKNTKCGKTPGTPVPGCIKGDTYYGTWSQFAGSGSAAIQKALKKINLTVDGHAFSGKTKASVGISPGGSCGAEAGFQISGSVKPPKPLTYSTYSMTVCLGTVTLAPGPGDPSSFINNLTIPGSDVLTANVDSASSSLVIS